MKVIKRDGRIVDYDRSKIKLAIEKANKEVIESKKASNEDIKLIINYIEELNKKRILVEDIQDIIEQKLMEIGRYELAKKYIVYRYTRALIRKSNTTDESILGLIKNENKIQDEGIENKKTILAPAQRNYIAGEVSKDLTKRLLLPEKISKAHEEGILYFHDSEYFVQPICNCSIINLGDMLENGTEINGEKIECPTSFKSACLITTQILQAVGSSQYGEETINIKHLGKYLKESKNKIGEEIKKLNIDKLSSEKIAKAESHSELEFGIKLIIEQINTLITSNGHSILVSFLLQIDQNDKYLEENAEIIEEILQQIYEKLNNQKFKSPKLIYVLDDLNSLKGGKYDYITNMAIKCAIKSSSIMFLSSKIMKEKGKESFFSYIGNNNSSKQLINEKNNQFEGKFNQGIVSINLPQIGIVADGNEEKFWDELNKRLELCREALMCRHYGILGTKSDISPIFWQNGAISRLKKGEKVDKLLYGEHSNLSLGYIGIYEVTKLIKGVSHITEEGFHFALKLMNYLKKVTEKWSKESNITFLLYGIDDTNLSYNLAKIDKEKYGTIQDITDKGFYTVSYHIPENENIEFLDKIKLESKFQAFAEHGSTFSINISRIKDDFNQIKEVIKLLYNNIQLTKFNVE